MPIYEYICEDCGSRYERIVLSQAQAVSCPKCASSRRTLQLSVFSAQTKSEPVPPRATPEVPPVVLAHAEPVAAAGTRET
jgi:putative FmdB family regulatory protein